jgi:CheY-like chemotaxis protein
MSPVRPSRRLRLHISAGTTPTLYPRGQMMRFASAGRGERPGGGRGSPRHGDAEQARGAAQARVLVIDDEAPIRLLCRVNLRLAGMEVLEAANGAAGIELARAERPDLILLDVMMPEVDGWEVIARLAEDSATSDIPIVFLTARSERRDERRGLEAGAVGYVTKPFDPVQIGPFLLELLGRIERGEREAVRAERLRELGRD